MPVQTARGHASLEDTVDVGSRGIIVVANVIEGLLAEIMRAGTVRITRLEAEDGQAQDAKRKGLSSSRSQFSKINAPALLIHLLGAMGLASMGRLFESLRAPRELAHWSAPWGLNAPPLSTGRLTS